MRAAPGIAISARSATSSSSRPTGRPEPRRAARSSVVSNGSFVPHASFKRVSASIALDGRSAASGESRSSIQRASPLGNPEGGTGRARRPSRTAARNPATSRPLMLYGGLPCTAS